VYILLEFQIPKLEVERPFKDLCFKYVRCETGVENAIQKMIVGTGTKYCNSNIILSAFPVCVYLPHASEHNMLKFKCSKIS
jgi:hypothetical protein